MTRQRVIPTVLAVIALAVLIGDWASYQYGSDPSAAATRHHRPPPTTTSIPEAASGDSVHRAAGANRANVAESKVAAGATTTSLPLAKPSVTTPVTSTTRPSAPKHHTKAPVTTTTVPPPRKVTTVKHRVTATTTTTTTTTTTPPDFATRTSVSAGVQATNKLVVAAATYCVFCTSQRAPSSGHESISLVDAASGATLATWTTTATLKAVGIVWTYTVGESGAYFDLDAAAARNATWSGPSSVLVPESNLAGNQIGVQASFSGATRLSASLSMVADVTI